MSQIAHEEFAICSEPIPSFSTVQFSSPVCDRISFQLNTRTR